ncbi:phosphoenolpyruvate carboxykinase [GTP], mitochondrial-like [Penaeus japonicus]|uniref:phosphoenolpyruvate carboxykinase [GTP], mitochondrial-like n=1 Tax=Penaeus japonicus TaxID=27405 RepID=UPI001C70E5E4|nr:phosphoenolpyruvate carboxykinase [GTP], mitochondrial-like [Penaeus japonicus]
MVVLPSAASNASGTRRVMNVIVLTTVEDFKNHFKQEVSSISFNKLTDLLSKVRTFVEIAHVWEPAAFHPGDGSDRELHDLPCMTQQAGMMAEPLPEYTNCWLARSDLGDRACSRRNRVFILEMQ